MGRRVRVRRDREGRVEVVGEDIVIFVRIGCGGEMVCIVVWEACLLVMTGG